MKGLKGSTARRLAAGLPELYAAPDFVSLSQVATRMLADIVPMRFCDSAVFCRRPNGTPQITTFHGGPGSWTESELTEWSRVQETFAHENPLLVLPIAALSHQAIIGSQIVPDSWFQECALGSEVFLPMGANRQLFVCAPMPGGVFFFTSNREGMDFNDKDLAAMEFLRPHLQKLTREQIAQREGALAISSLQNGAEAGAIGIFVLDSRSLRVKRATASAVRSLRTHSLAIQNDSLPDSILRWLLAQRDPVRWVEGRTPTWLHLKHGSSQVEVRFIENAEADEMYLVLTEELKQPDPARFQAMGLTPREAEVLHWIAEGKTSREMGSILGCSSHTVDKHAERILAKLGVENRKAAAAEARRWDHGS